MPSKSFDVFLSHNSRNKPEVRELYHALKDKGLKPWLDEEELRPGQLWQPALEQALNDCRAVAVLIGAHGFGEWHEQEMQAALTIATRQQIPVIPVRLPSCPANEATPAFLGIRTWVDLSPQLDAHNLQRLICGINGDKTTTSSTSTVPIASLSNPFHFGVPASGSRFVGRDNLCRRFMQDIERALSISLVGDARIGKSSLLHRWQILAGQAGYRVRLINGQGAAGASCAAFVKAITGYGSHDLSAEEAANALCDWIEAEVNGKAPVVLVDEAERALGCLPTRFFERLRGLVNSSKLCLVLASRCDISEIECHDHKTSPLANCLKKHTISLLEEPAVAQLCEAGQPLLGEEGHALMCQWAGKHPFFLTLLGDSLWLARQEGDGLEKGLKEFLTNARLRLEEWFTALPAREQGWLADALNGAPLPPASTLNERGLLDHGQPFGQVLTWWWAQRG